MYQEAGGAIETGCSTSVDGKTSKGILLNDLERKNIPTQHEVTASLNVLFDYCRREMEE